MQTEMELRMFKQNEYVYHSMREAALKNKPMTMMHEPKSVEEGVSSIGKNNHWMSVERNIYHLFSLSVGACKSTFIHMDNFL